MNLKKKSIKSPYKSKGESEIAKLLKSLDIEFEYEFPIAVVDNDNKTKIWYPDFYLKEYQIVIEYFGMYEHNKQYRENTEYKKGVYKNCGIQFLPVYHIRKNWQEYILKTILAHQEMKTDKINKILAKYNKKTKSIVNRIKWRFWE